MFWFLFLNCRQYRLTSFWTERTWLEGSSVVVPPTVEFLLCPQWWTTNLSYLPSAGFIENAFSMHTAPVNEVEKSWRDIIIMNVKLNPLSCWKTAQIYPITQVALARLKKFSSILIRTWKPGQFDWFKMLLLSYWALQCADLPTCLRSCYVLRDLQCLCVFSSRIPHIKLTLDPN